MKKISRMAFMILTVLPVFAFAQTDSIAIQEMQNRARNPTKIKTAPAQQQPQSKPQKTPRAIQHPTSIEDDKNQPNTIGGLLVPSKPAQLPPGVQRIPHQTPVPKSTSSIRNVHCRFTTTGAVRAYTCTDTITGKTASFPEFDNFWIANAGRNTPNAPFMDINYFHINFFPPEEHFLNYTSEKDLHVWLPFDTTTMLPAFSVPRFNMDVIRDQVEAEVIKFPDGSPVTDAILKYQITDNSAYKFFFLDEAHDAKLRSMGINPRDLRYDNSHTFPKVLEFPSVRIKKKPPVASGGILPDDFLNPRQGPAAAPRTVPLPSTGGLDSTSPSAGTIFQSPTYGLSTISDWWNQNKITGHGSFALYLEFTVARWGGGKNKNAPPPPEISADGNALNFYFTVHGLPYAFSLTDLNGDRVYEAHFIKLKFDVDNPGVTKFDFEFQNEKELQDYANTHQLKLPSSK